MVRGAEIDSRFRPTESSRANPKKLVSVANPTSNEALVTTPHKNLLPKHEALKTEEAAAPETKNVVLFTYERKRSVRERLKEKAKERLSLKMESAKDSAAKRIKAGESFFEQKFGKTLDSIASFTFLVLAGPQIMDNIEPEFVPGAEERLREILKDPNNTLFIHSNHGSIAEIVAKARFAKKLKKITRDVRDDANTFPGTTLTYAGSLTAKERDGQGIYAKRLAQFLKKKLAKSSNLFMEEYVREKDLKKYGVSTDKNNRLALRLYRYIKNGFAIDAFTPGTVEESRFTVDENGNQHRKGLQELDFAPHLRLMEIAEKLGRNVVFLPTAMEGGRDVIDPTDGEEPRPTRKAALACLDLRNSPGIRTILRKLHLGNKPLITMKIGMPIFKTEMMEQIKEQTDGREITINEISNYAGYEVAKLMSSPEGQGFYKINP